MKKKEKKEKKEAAEFTNYFNNIINELQNGYPDDSNYFDTLDNKFDKQLLENETFCEISSNVTTPNIGLATTIMVCLSTQLIAFVSTTTSLMLFKEVSLATVTSFIAPLYTFICAYVFVMLSRSTSCHYEIAKRKTCEMMILKHIASIKKQSEQDAMYV